MTSASAIGGLLSSLLLILSLAILAGVVLPNLSAILAALKGE